MSTLNKHQLVALFMDVKVVRHKFRDLRARARLVQTYPGSPLGHGRVCRRISSLPPKQFLFFTIFQGNTREEYHASWLSTPSQPPSFPLEARFGHPKQDPISVCYCYLFENILPCAIVKSHLATAVPSWTYASSAAVAEAGADLKGTYQPMAAIIFLHMHTYHQTLLFVFLWFVP
uniref:Uncharacterized protein n=1 Tax=Coccidioides posadasii RMSCC 3488 TaxID=454284 RepID=A0A0J6F7P6_COCPO|nr:hypothetical protein CPAG_01316 [Coccidioides posadasii RMSCC 3488]